MIEILRRKSLSLPDHVGSHAEHWQNETGFIGFHFMGGVGDEGKIKSFA